MNLLRFQWVFLVLLVAVLTIVQAHEGHGEAGHVHAEDEEEILLDAEEEPVAEPEVEEVDVVEEEVPEPPKDEPAPEPVKEKVSKEEAPVPEKVDKSGPSPLSKIKSKVSDAVTCCTDKCKAFADKCKNMSKDDMKKAAAAVVTVWGVSAGIGWLAQQNSVSAAVAAPVPRRGRK
jgi:outer membrane biosynthesis protein TonB